MEISTRRVDINLKGQDSSQVLLSNSYRSINRTNLVINREILYKEDISRNITRYIIISFSYNIYKLLFIFKYLKKD